MSIQPGDTYRPRASISRWPVPVTRADLHEASVLDRHIRHNPRIAHAVEHAAVANDDVVGGRLLRRRCRQRDQRRKTERKDSCHARIIGDGSVFHRFGQIRDRSSCAGFQVPEFRVRFRVPRSEVLGSEVPGSRGRVPFDARLEIATEPEQGIPEPRTRNREPRNPGTQRPSRTSYTPSMPFGREMLSLWPLDPAATYLNHGTVGVVPRQVLEAQQRWRDRIERHPSRFMLRELWSFSGAEAGGPTLMRQAAAEVASFVGANANDLVFVDNTTTGVNAVVQSLPLQPGDEIVITDHAYGGIVTAVRHAAQRAMAPPSPWSQMPYPAFDADEAVRRIESALSARTRLVDHRPHRVGDRAHLSRRGHRPRLPRAQCPSPRRRRACARRPRPERVRHRRGLLRRQPAQVGDGAAQLRVSRGGARVSGGDASRR